MKVHASIEISGSEANIVPARKKITLQCPIRKIKQNLPQMGWANAKINYKIAINATHTCHLLHGPATPFSVAALAPPFNADTNNCTCRSQDANKSSCWEKKIIKRILPRQHFGIVTM